MKYTENNKEGDLYKVITIDSHVFELRFGYYEDFERAGNNPVVVYPDLEKDKRYTACGLLIVTAIQEPCSFYRSEGMHESEDCCGDCVYFYKPRDEIGICRCEGKRAKNKATHNKNKK